MDPTTGKLFGAIGEITGQAHASAFIAGTTDPEYSRWYSQQWRRCHDLRPAGTKPQRPDTLV